MILGFTGTSGGMTEAQIAAVTGLFETLPVEVFVHGGCVGADTEAHHIALGADVLVEVYPSNIHSMQGDWTSAFRIAEPAPPIMRNHVIVRRCGYLVACPAGREILRSGTWAAVRYARRIGRAGVIVYPDGRCTTLQGATLH